MKEGTKVIVIKDCSFFNKGDKAVYLRHEGADVVRVKLPDGTESNIYGYKIQKLQSKTAQLKARLLK